MSSSSSNKRTHADEPSTDEKIKQLEDKVDEQAAQISILLQTVGRLFNKDKDADSLDPNIYGRWIEKTHGFPEGSPAAQLYAAMINFNDFKREKERNPAASAREALANAAKRREEYEKKQADRNAANGKTNASVNSGTGLPVDK